MSGGVVAVNNPGPEVNITAGFGGPVLSTIRIPSYDRLLAIISALGVPVVGTTFIVDREEALLLRRPQFRAFNGSSMDWLVEDSYQRWRQIAHASGQRDEMQLMDVAARVASCLSYSEMGLQDLAKAYSTQLRCHLHGSPVQEYARFKDTNSRVAYKEIHSLFREMAVLRDTLAEFIAQFCYSKSRINTLGDLLTWLHKEHASDDLAVQLFEVTDESKRGWLWEFTAYRNLFTHRSPMELVAGVAFTVQDTRQIATEQSIPQIYYPLPPNAHELLRQRRDGPLFKTFQELLDASEWKRHERHSEPDALDYLSSCLNRLAQLSAFLIGRSPVKPQPIEIAESEIIGEIKVSLMR
jgi:hypothetical protein